MQETNFSREQLHAFICLFAAYADQEFSSEEILIAKGELSQDDFDEVKDCFVNSSDFERIQTILSYKEKYFPTKEKQDDIVKMMEKIFHADDNYDIREKNTKRIFDRIIH